MHELSIAYNIVQIASDAGLNAGASRVVSVHLRLGALSGVVSDALRLGYDIASEGSILQGSQLEIEEIPVSVYCPQCKAEKILDTIQDFRCPVCGMPTADIRQGKELEIAYLEIEDEPAHS